MAPELISRKTAIAQGLPHYFTGKPCVRGHIAPHSVHGGCAVCNADRASSTRYKARKRQYYCDNRDEVKRKNNAARIKRLYGISIEGYEALLKKQDYVCAICRQPNKSGRRLCVDHDHSTGVVRGLLCNDCNKVIVATMDKCDGALARLNDYLK